MYLSLFGAPKAKPFCNYYFSWLQHQASHMPALGTPIINWHNVGLEDCPRDIHHRLVKTINKD